MERFWNAFCMQKGNRKKTKKKAIHPNLNENLKNSNESTSVCLIRHIWSDAARVRLLRWLWMVGLTLSKTRNDEMVLSLTEAISDTPYSIWSSPHSLDELFCPLSLFQMIFEKACCFASHCSRHLDKCLIIALVCWPIKSIEFLAPSLSDNRIVLAHLWNQSGLFPDSGSVLWYHTPGDRTASDIMIDKWTHICHWWSNNLPYIRLHLLLIDNYFLKIDDIKCLLLFHIHFKYPFPCFLRGFKILSVYIRLVVPISMPYWGSNRMWAHFPALSQALGGAAD